MFRYGRFLQSKPIENAMYELAMTDLQEVRGLGLALTAAFGPETPWRHSAWPTAI